MGAVVIEFAFTTKPMHAAINPARKCKCVRSKKTGRAIGQPYTRGEYDDAKHEMHSAAWRSMLGEPTPVYPNGPVHVEIVTHGERTHRTGPATGLAQIDADATTKCVLDALTGVTYTDDSQVLSVTASKTTDGPVGIRVRIYRPEELETDEA